MEKNNGKTEEKKQSVCCTPPKPATPENSKLIQGFLYGLELRKKHYSP